jgi:hypothetical protein
VTALVNIASGHGTCRREFVALKGGATPRAEDCLRIKGEVFRILVVVHQTTEPDRSEWAEFLPDSGFEFDLELLAEPEDLPGITRNDSQQLSFVSF